MNEPFFHTFACVVCGKTDFIDACELLDHCSKHQSDDKLISIIVPKDAYQVEWTRRPRKGEQGAFITGVILI